MSNLKTVRAKMVLNSMTDYGNSMSYSFGCVYSNDPDSENKRFAEATPSGCLTISISKQSAHPEVQHFLTMLQNQEVYVDITPAPGNQERYLEDRFPAPGKKALFKFGKDGEWVEGEAGTEEVDSPYNTSYKYNRQFAIINGEKIVQGSLPHPEKRGDNIIPSKGWYWKYAE